jgi:hypothetical protein
MQDDYEEETLEPIHPIGKTPYGALLIEENVLCTPTSLCTWDEQKKATVYCKLPQHTLNPVCQKTNQGIGLVGCYAENTCGGLVHQTTTKKLLEERPHYKEVIHQEEVKFQQEKKKHENIVKKGKEKNIYYLLISVLCLLILLFFALVWLTKTYFHKKRKRNVSQTQKR